MMDTAEQTQCTYPTSEISHCGDSNEMFSNQKLQPTPQSSWDTSKPIESQDSWNSSQSLQQTPQLRDIFSSPIPTYSSPSHGRWSDLNQNGDNHNSANNNSVNEIQNNIINNVHNNIVQNNISNNVQENAANFFAEEAARMWEASQLQSQFNQMNHPFFYNPSDDNFIPRMDVMMAQNQWDLGLTQNDSNYYPLVDPISDNPMKFEMNHQFDNRFNSNPFDFPQLIPRFPNHDANLLSLEASLPNPFPSMDQTNQRKARKAKSVSSVTSAATGTSPPSDLKSKPSSSYRCDFEGCGKTFTRPYNLKAHARIHTQERPFSCLVCHYAFSRLHDMKRHMNLHSGLKPFQCPHCTKSFARLDALNRHVKKDAGTCSTVSRSKFSRTQTL